MVLPARFRLELNRVDPQDKDKRKKINRLAEKLVECALEDKQGRAFLIVDRLEGKPVQVVDATVDDHRTLHEYSDAELTAMLRQACWRRASRERSGTP